MKTTPDILYMENECILVSSKGIRKSCLEYKELALLKPNGLLYVASDFVYGFSLRIHEIRVPFVLVTGDSDYTLPFDLFPNETSLTSFLGNPNLTKWYVQNCVYEHEKIVQLPIGLDYHTFRQTTPLEQEKSLLDIEKQETQLKIYSNCHFAMNTRYGNDRREAIFAIPRELLVLEPSYVPRIESWKHQSQYRFCLSPHGNGLDCHRTWEALCLGTIPIVKTSKLDDMYRDLPVLIVKDWKDVNETLLRETVESFQTRTFQLEKLTLQYWINRMKKKSLCIVCHSGLGDHLFMIGGVRFLTTFYDTIYLCVNEKYKKQIRTFYRDPRIVLIPMTFSTLQEERKQIGGILSEMTGDVLICGLWKSFFDTQITNPSFLAYTPPLSDYTMDVCSVPTRKYKFIEDFYRDMNLTLTHFYEGFHIDTTVESIQLYDRVKSYTLVFIQQNSSDGYILPLQPLLEKYLWKEDTLLVCNDSNLYEGIEGLEYKKELVAPFVRNDILSYKELIQHCDEIYMIDSCFLGMIIPYYKRNQLNAKVIEITIR